MWSAAAAAAGSAAAAAGSGAAACCCSAGDNCAGARDGIDSCLAAGAGVAAAAAATCCLREGCAGIADHFSCCRATEPLANSAICSEASSSEAVILPSDIPDCSVLVRSSNSSAPKHVESGGCVVSIASRTLPRSSWSCAARSPDRLQEAPSSAVVDCSRHCTQRIQPTLCLTSHSVVSCIFVHSMAAGNLTFSRGGQCEDAGLSIRSQHHVLVCRRPNRSRCWRRRRGHSRLARWHVRQSRGTCSTPPNHTPVSSGANDPRLGKVVTWCWWDMLRAQQKNGIWHWLQCDMTDQEQSLNAGSHLKLTLQPYCSDQSFLQQPRELFIHAHLWPVQFIHIISAAAVSPVLVPDLDNAERQLGASCVKPASLHPPVGGARYQKATQLVVTLQSRVNHGRGAQRHSTLGHRTSSHHHFVELVS
jgi:hypothetical protein